MQGNIKERKLWQGWRTSPQDRICQEKVVTKETQLLGWHRGHASMLKMVLDCSKTSALLFHLEVQEELYISGHIPQTVTL